MTYRFYPFFTRLKMGNLVKLALDIWECSVALGRAGGKRKGIIYSLPVFFLTGRTISIFMD